MAQKGKRSKKWKSWRQGTPSGGRSYYSIGEVARLFDIEEHMLRYWETVTPLAPKRSPSSDARMYTKEDLELVEQLRLYIVERGVAPAVAAAIIQTKEVDIELQLHSKLTEARSRLQDILEAIGDFRNGRREG